MKAPKKATIFLAATLLASGPARADLNGDMQQMFDSMGVLGNYSSPTAFTAQGKGFLVGGGVSVRTPIRPIVPVSFQRPSFSAGCGGIDMHLGSISFADLDEYKHFFENLPNVALGYSLKVGLDAISNTLRGAFDSIEGVVNQANSFAKSQCQAAQFAVHNAIGLVAATDYERCKQRRLGEGKNESQAENLCKKEKTKGGEAPVDSLKPVSGNVVWKALGKVKGLSQHDKELIMSIFGTVVIDPSGLEPKSFPPTVKNFQEFFKGKTMTLNTKFSVKNLPFLDLYKCDEAEECLAPKPVPLPVPTFPHMVEDRLTIIAENLLKGQRQDAASIGFINGTRFPVFRMMVLATATGDSSLSESFINQYRDVIAIELAIAYIDKLMSEAIAVIASSQNNLSTVESNMLNGLLHTGRAFKLAAREEEKSLGTKISSRQALHEELEVLQRSIYSNVPENVRRLMTAGR